MAQLFCGHISRLIESAIALPGGPNPDDPTALDVPEPSGQVRNLQRFDPIGQLEAKHLGIEKQLAF